MKASDHILQCLYARMNGLDRRQAGELDSNNYFMDYTTV